VAPILGALLAGFIYTWLVGDDIAEPPVVGEPAASQGAGDVVVIEEI